MSEKTTFKFKNWGNEYVLSVGQKVECVYYHESIQMHKDGKSRGLLSLLFDDDFTPVKLGIIVGSAGVMPYYLAGSTDTGKGGFEGGELYL
jgi:hypothetical protein